MPGILRTTSIASLLLVCSALFASGPDVQVVVPMVAAATLRDGIRFVASPTVCQIRVQVISTSGATLLDSGWRDGNLLDWSAADLVSGTHRCLITVTDLDGSVTTRETSVVVEGGKLSIDRARLGGTAAITSLVHDGTNGSVVNGAGDLSFRFGDILRAEDQERLRITADGRVGIGTDKPQASLDVNGIIRAQGIEFPDGSILTSPSEVQPGDPASPPRTTTPRPAGMNGLVSRPVAPMRNAAPKPHATPALQFVADETGVHIGTVPAYGLDVAGNIATASNLLLPNTANASTGVLSIGGVPYLHNSGYQSLFLGHTAGNFSNAGSYNTGIGYLALNTSANASFNTALGNEALKTNAAGDSNTAIGAFALTLSDGDRNTAVGNGALSNNSSGEGNTAVGYGAMATNTTGVNNTAIGQGALGFYAGGATSGNTAAGFEALSRTVGNYNTAHGYAALHDNTTGVFNTAIGRDALVLNADGANNTAVGAEALSANSSGTFNVAIGYAAGQNVTTGSFNVHIANNGVGGDNNVIRIGNGQAKTFIAGVRDVTTAAGAVAILVDTNGQLGTLSSSRRYKFDIRDAGDSTSNLMQLRPVTFRYTAHGPDAPVQYGLIAEEVADVYPDLVARNRNGEIETVQYQFLSPMLLNEFQKQQRTIEELRATVAELSERLQTLERERTRR